MIDALRFSLDRERFSPWYALRVVVVALLVLVLPVAYVAMVALLGWALFWHATRNGMHSRITEVFTNPAASILLTEIWLFVGYFVPLVLGSALLVLLLKPLFTRSRRVDAALHVTRNGEPFLFEFLDQLARTLHAPPPKTVRVDCEPNASGGFHDGTSGVLGNRRVVTIGLTLASRMPLQELAGVLAHEIGHLRQGGALRMRFAIGAVNGWFGRVIRESIRWDARLAAVPTSARSIFYAKVLRGLIRLARKPVTGFFWLGVRMSNSLSREMERDADAMQVAVAGSDCVKSALERIRALGAANLVAGERLKASWAEGRLADDIPELINREAERTPAADLARIRSALDRAAQQRFPTHPEDADRIAVAQTAGAQAAFVSDQPATVLFTAFGELCRRATALNYRVRIGPKVKPNHLVPVDEITGRAEAVGHQIGAQNRYFQALPTMLFPLAIEGARTSSGSVDEAKEEIAAIRERVTASGAAARASIAAAGHVVDRISRARQGDALLRATFTLTKGQFGLKRPDLDACREALRAAEEEIEQRRLEVAPLLHALSRRLGLGLDCLERSSGQEPRRTEAATLRAVAAAIEKAASGFVSAALSFDVVQILLANGQGKNLPEAFHRTFRSAATELWRWVEKLRSGLEGVSYPFDHAGRRQTIGKHVVPELKSPKEVPLTCGAFVTARDRLRTLYFRTLGRLAEIAEDVERDLGFEPLPDPVAEDRPL